MTTDPADVAKIIRVADGITVRQAVDNMAWIDLGEWALVVDALEQHELEDEVFDAIGSTLGDRPIRYVLNTHTHYDHVALNEAFRRRCGAEIVNATTCDIPPEGRWFQGPSRRAGMLPFPGCHTDEDCVVHLSDDGVLLVGDIFGWGLIPLVVNLRQDSARLLRETYAKLIAFDAEVVVPGHGPLCSTDTLRRWVEYFDWLIAETSRACREGRRDAEILASLGPPEDMKSWWRFVAWKHQDSVSKVLKSVRRGWLEG